MTTNITIRSESQQDYFGIAEIHALAFTYSHATGEVPLVDVHRHRTDFDADLSLVAEMDGRIVGHTLLTPRWVKLSNQLVRAVIVAPVAVVPGLQKSGIGALMMEEGHERAMKKGCDFAILTGHSDYYPRFGYVTHMFGDSSTCVNRKDIMSGGEGLSERRVRPEDVEQLVSWWHLWTRDVDLSVYPGQSILDWISPHKDVCSSVVETDGESLGYVRYQASKPELIQSFLAKSSEAAAQILAFMNQKILADVDTIALPIHANGPTTKQFLTVAHEGRNRTWAAAMIKILNPEHRLIRDYCSGVKCGHREPGQIVWPVEFDVC